MLHCFTLSICEGRLTCTIALLHIFAFVIDVFRCLFLERLANVRGDLVPMVQLSELLLSYMMQNFSPYSNQKSDIQWVRALLVLVIEGCLFMLQFYIFLLEGIVLS